MSQAPVGVPAASPAAGVIDRRLRVIGRIRRILLAAGPRPAPSPARARCPTIVNTTIETWMNRNGLLNEAAIT